MAVLSKITKLLLLSSTGAYLAEACGVLVHNEVFRRAQYIFARPLDHRKDDLRAQISKIISDPSRANLVQAGSFFPDWGYGCFSNDAGAEDAHWPPFFIAASNHIIKKYGPLSTSINDDHVKDLIAFIYAASAHGSADATWHSLGMTDGLLTTMAALDFGGDYGAAHTHLDPGGDIIFANRLAGLPAESKKWVSLAWKVPIDDIVEIYASMGRSVDKVGLGFCAYRGLAAMLAEVAAGAALYIPYAAKSPAMVDLIDGFWLGGVEEMAGGAAHCWGNLTSWLGGVQSSNGGWDMCDVFKMHNTGTTKQNEGNGHKHGSFLESISKNPVFFKKFQDNLSKVQKARDPKTGAETYALDASASAPVNGTAKPSSNNKAKGELVPNVKAATSFGEPIYISTYEPFSQFSRHMALGNYSTEQPGILLAVSAPMETGYGDEQNAGAIYVIDVKGVIEQNKGGNQKRANVARSAKKIRAVMNEKRADRTPSDANAYNDRFGSAVGTWRPSTDRELLVITAPDTVANGNSAGGRVEIYKGGDRQLTVQMSGVGISSTGRKGFGTAFVSADIDGDGSDEIIISASRSASPTCNSQDEGVVLAFRLPQINTAAKGSVLALDDLEPITLTLPGKTCGQSSWEWFGATLAFLPKSKLLAVGAPGKSTVYLFKYNTSLKTFDLATSIKGPDHTGFGGFALETGINTDGTEWLAVSSPNEDVGLIPALGKNGGSVRVYTVSGATATLRLQIASSKGEMFGKFGMSLKADPSQGGLYIGSPWAESERGAVWYADMNGLLNSSQGVKSVNLDAVLTGPEAKAHFGASLAVSDVDGDGKSDLMVGIPYTGVAGVDQDKRFEGAVAVYLRS